MAAVFFKYTTDKEKFSRRDHSTTFGCKKKSVEAFLTSNGWYSVGNQVFYSDPSFGTAKEQILSQANALRDIEELVKWRPSLREFFKDTLIIVGQVYDIDSLLKTSDVVDKKRTKKEKNGKQGVSLDLASREECSVKKHPVSLKDNSKSELKSTETAKPVKFGQSGVKSPQGLQLKNTPRPSRNRPMGSASKVTSRPIVNYPKAPVKTIKNKATTSRLISGRCSSDINSNLLAALECGAELVYDEEDMTPLYLPCLEDEEEEEEEERDEEGQPCRCQSHTVSPSVNKPFSKKSAVIPPVNRELKIQTFSGRRRRDNPVPTVPAASVESLMDSCIRPTSAITSSTL
ncbi:hypothetical protein AWC38_SpisGene14078 [Stylophora pistillata]|uniref:Uncharacterized protein n=1 Tax=Stylophora pistillata TaxID=50429 RepID=A0A2B4RSN5_STYPI|nr:hypothetical protein AWC38_SpisGene14078 [Stylophora pistillata]